MVKQEKSIVKIILNKYIKIRKAKKDGKYELWNTKTGELFGIDEDVFNLITDDNVDLLLTENKHDVKIVVENLIGKNIIEIEDVYDKL